MAEESAKSSIFRRARSLVPNEAGLAAENLQKAVATTSMSLAEKVLAISVPVVALAAVIARKFIKASLSQLDELQAAVDYLESSADFSRML